MSVGWSLLAGVIIGFALTSFAVILGVAVSTVLNGTATEKKSEDIDK